MRRGRRPHPDILTPREWEVLELVRVGMTNEEIAARLGISLAGSRYHVSEILSKLNVGSRHEAAEWLVARRATQAEAAGGRRMPALLAAPGLLFSKLKPTSLAGWMGRAAIFAAVVALAVLGAAVLVARERGSTVLESAVRPLPTAMPEEHGAVDFSRPTLGARYVTEWALPDFMFEGRPAGADGTGIEAALPELIAATLAGDAAAVSRAGQRFGVATLRTVPQDPDDPACGGGYGLCFWTAPLAPAGGGGEYWAVVSGGWVLVPAGSPLAADGTRMDGTAAAFQHFVAVYERRADGTWSGELARTELDDPRGECCDLTGASWAGGGRPFFAANDALASDDPAWRRFSASIDEELAMVDWEQPAQGITTLLSPGGGARSRLVLQGPAVMASFAAVFYVLEFDAERMTLSVEHANLHRRWGGDLRDLDGYGRPEVLINESDAYVFGGASGTEETFVRLLRWQDGELKEVALETPDGLPPDIATRVEHALNLAGADLWTDAARLLGQAAKDAPQHFEVRWLARRVQLIALGRLLQAERQGKVGDGGLSAPFLMMAGDYEAVVETMRRHEPEELFGPGGVGYLFANLSGPNGGLALDYTGRALAVVPERAEVHAVRALAFTLTTPPDFSAAAALMAEAARLSPDDDFYADALEWLRENGAE